jgi:hypothetical protein
MKRHACHQRRDLSVTTFMAIPGNARQRSAQAISGIPTM